MAKKQDLIGYCGDCAGYTQTVADLARDLRKELRHYRFDKRADILAKVPFFKGLENYNKCYRLLGTMLKMRCKKTCRGSGGLPNCKIRNGIAHLKNLRKLKKQGPAAFIKGKRYWYAAK